MQVRIYSYIRNVFSKYAPLGLKRGVERIFEIVYQIKWGYYQNNTSVSNDVICMIDGKIKHGGLTDRINGIVSCYHYANINNRNFKIYFDHPFLLQDYLCPNIVDWLVPKNYDLTPSSKSKIIFLRAINPIYNKKRGIQLNYEIARHPNKQLHVYTNINSVDDDQYQHLFNNLFKPSDKLKKYIESEKAKINNPYISATYRFQQLLGDFSEGNFKKLDKKTAETLIKQCIESLWTIHNENPEYKILVTSDSPTFLELVKDFDFVLETSGKVIHMEYNTSSDFLSQGKAFLDLFMIADAQIIYSIVIGPMLKSGFPKFASKINGRKFVLMKNTLKSFDS